jgi:hypothetical protein
MVHANTNNIRYTATAKFSDGTEQDVTVLANWISSDDSIAHVKTNSGFSNGEVSAKETGTATITATVPSLSGASGFTTIIVIP